MRFIDILSENIATKSPDLDKLKQIIGGKIKTLPQTQEAFKTLKEIEDLLQNVNAGGRIGLINSVLSEIPDETVREAQRELARYIAGIDMTPEDRADLFKRWKTDSLINHKLLLTGGKHTFSEIVNGYNSNPAIKELTDDLSRVVGYGHGKGEFVLNVFSKNIGKGENNKGDLIINGKSIEVKTTDAGGARFGDQEVKPGPDYFDAVSNFTNTIIKPLGLSFPKSGINTKTIQELYTQTKDKKKFENAIIPVVRGLFPAVDTKNAVTALLSGDFNSARQEFAIASLTNYLNQKKDYGVLYIDISRSPYTFIFFRNNEELNQAGFRLDISTQYLVTYDTQRVAAQFTIVPSGRIAAQQLQQIAPTGTAKKPTAQVTSKVKNWASNFANNRNVSDPATVQQIAQSTSELLAQGLEVQDIILSLEKKFPKLKVVKKQKKPQIKPVPVVSPATQPKPALKVSQPQMGSSRANQRI
jgi:hypothetical protein